MPEIRSLSDGSGDGGGGEVGHAYPLRSSLVRASGRIREGNDENPMPRKKSDHFIVAMNPTKVGGAK
jgi:hypothetical protein